MIIVMYDIILITDYHCQMSNIKFLTSSSLLKRSLTYNRSNTDYYSILSTLGPAGRGLPP